MANWSTLTIKNAITKIKGDEMVLPVIQRRLVWNEDKMEMLFDSLLKGNPFGAVICIEEEKGSAPLFAFRKFTQDGRDVDSIAMDELSKTQLFVIDGQQRMQSFYLGLTGTCSGKRLYFDLYSDFEHDEFDFKFAENAEKLPKKNRERRIENCCWYPVSDLFDKLSETNDDDQIGEELAAKYAEEDALQIKFIERNIRIFYRSIFNFDSIGISKVKVNKTKPAVENRQHIVELFRRLNDGGTPLSSYDLVASMFKGFDYKMEQFLDQTVARHSDIGIDQDVLIKLLLILNDKPMKDMTDLTAEDAEFAVSNFGRIQETLEAMKRFLIASSHYSWFHTNKNRSAIPLYFLAYHIFYSSVETQKLTLLFKQYETNDSDYIAMHEWLHLSLLNKVFSRGHGWIPYRTGIRKIHTVMKANKGKPFPKSQLLQTYFGHPLWFTDKITAESFKTYDFDMDYIFYCIYDGKPSIRQEDIDHIHPHSLLRGAGFEETEINLIGNYQLLDSTTNRGSKNAKPLHEWIQKHVDNQKLYLDRHLIPKEPSLWETENYQRFRQEREKLIADKLERF